MPEDEGLSEGFRLCGHPVVAPRQRWFQTKLVSGKVERDQVLRENVCTNRPVHLRNLPWRGMDKAVMKFKIADHNLIDPRLVATPRPYLPTASSALPDSFARPNLFPNLPLK